MTERIWACVSLQWEWLGGAEAADPAIVEAARAARDIPRRVSGRGLESGAEVGCNE